MSIFGQTRQKRFATATNSLRVCSDCGYDGDEHNREVDACGHCGANMPAGGPDHCTECGQSNCLMIACPECGGEMSLDYETMEPRWDAQAAFRRYVRRETSLTPS